MSNKLAIKQFYCVVDASPVSTMSDVMFKASVDSLVQIIQGAGPKLQKEHLTLYPATHEGRTAATQDAQQRLAAGKRVQSEGFYIARTKAETEFFTSNSSYGRPAWTPLSEATMYPTIEQAQQAVKKLWVNGTLTAKIVSFATITENVELEISMPENDVEEGLEDSEDNPCWTGYEPVGTKEKNGKTVPNCVPTDDVKEAALTTMPSRPTSLGRLPMDAAPKKYPAIGTLAWEKLPEWKKKELLKKRGHVTEDSPMCGEDEEEAIVAPKFKRGDAVVWQGKRYTVSIPNGRGNLVGIQLSPSDDVHMVRQGDLYSAEEEEMVSDEQEERAVRPAPFKYGDRVNYRGDEYTVVAVQPDSNVVTIAPDGDTMDETKFMKTTPQQLQHAVSEMQNPEHMDREMPADGKQIWVHTADGKRHGPFKSTDIANQFIVGRKLDAKVVVESATMPAKPPLDAKPSENDLTVPNVTKPPYDHKEIEFDDPTTKNDGKNQLADPHDEKVTLPAEVKSALKSQIVYFEQCAEEENSHDDTRASFCMTVADALTMLLHDLEAETVGGIKQSQIRMSTYMSPITQHIPEIVRDFIAYGGRKKTLKDLFDMKRGR